MASQIAHVLRGKHKPSFVPYLDCGDQVIVVNAEKVRVTKNKLKDKSYYHHSGYQGGIKEARAEEILAKHPERLIETAVKGMLPHNKLGSKVYTNLYVYKGSEHPHQAQKPEPMIERTVGDKQ
jgi:large subunit ribosomal protein L13